MRRWMMGGWVGLLGLGGVVGCGERAENPGQRTPPVAERPEAVGRPEMVDEQAVQRLREQTEQLAERRDERPEPESDARMGRQLSGVVTEAREDELLIRGSEGQSIVLRTDERTQVVRSGVRIQLESIVPGSEVRASYILQGEERVARRVEVGPRSGR
jgi:hypothetical protein